MEMANVRDAVNAVITAIMAQKDYLTAVDAKTGDGDHGLNMARGFTAAEERLAAPSTALHLCVPAKR